MHGSQTQRVSLRGPNAVVQMQAGLARGFRVRTSGE
jgi:hypothetical protein